MVARAAHSITIARPREQVFDYIADARHQRRWNPVCKAMEQTTPGPIGVGTRFRGTFQSVGEMNVEITEYERPTRLFHRAYPWLAEVTHLWEFTPINGGTRLDQHGEMRPKARGWLLAPLMPLIVRRNLRDTAVALKRELERKDRLTQSHH
jgi:uncharacterized protein YndB with AHSA1/START domain